MARNMWEIEVSHKGLNKYRHIRGSDKYVVAQKARAQEQAWDEMWRKKVTAHNRTKARESELRSKEDNKELALIRTAEAQQELERLEKLLSHTLSINDTIDWSSLEDKSPFQQKRPIKAHQDTIPREPQKNDDKYQPKFNILDTIFKKRKDSKIEKCSQLFATDFGSWLKIKARIETANANFLKQFNSDTAEWLRQKDEFEALQRENNQKIADNKTLYFQLNEDAVTQYCDLVLSNSEYSDYLPQDWELDYRKATKILIVDYSLPDIEALPKLKSVKYVPSTDSFAETYLTEAALNKLYDSVVYQIALRTLHELFEADTANGLDAIVFNGWVSSINKATGQSVTACILSVQASKDEFMAINLQHVDPKACFKQLKGVGSSKMHGLSPVAPILSINREDRRFVSPYDVVNGLDEVDNLAVMDWQDFENLIREIFHKEFASTGGEVKITQASRDGGVDAIAFDPDPIRGGKIVIQAKRYTNVVGVSAVRDLYGTTMNEGATKGILVTTADFGPDAYEFVKGKPLTLLNGGNLLHLLEKHGHKAKIDLREAKKILSARK